MLNKRSTRTALGLLTLGGLLTLSGCDHRTPPDPATLPDQPIYLLNDANQLLLTNVRNPNTPTATVGLSGLQQGEQLLGIDFRPATGQLYGLSNQSRLYVVNPATGAARAIGSPISPALSGTAIGFDFNPTVDRIRVVTNTGQNLRLNPETGGVQAVDGGINSVGIPNPVVTGAAYTNNRAGEVTTTLYDIDPNTDRLYIQNPPNNGTVVDVGPLGLDITAVGGFDISPALREADGQALAAVTFNGRSELQQVNLRTGRMQKLGDLPGTIVGLAIPTDLIFYTINNDALGISDVRAAGGLNSFEKGISGLQPGEQLLGIDFRPANGQLYGLGSTGRLYTLNTSNGVATLVGTINVPLTGTQFGFDFNPTVDRIRIVSNTGQNLRVNPIDATANVDGALNGATTTVTASAYTNNVAGATTTTLYNIDHSTGNLFIQTPPNNGTQVLVGSLGLGVVEANNGFDIGGATGTAYALLRVSGQVNLYTINLSTGAATQSRVVSLGTGFRAFAVGLGF